MPSEHVYFQKTLVPHPGLKNKEGRNFEHPDRRVYFICDRTERFLFIYEFRLKELDAFLQKNGSEEDAVVVDNLYNFNEKLSDAAQQFINAYLEGDLAISQYRELDIPEDIKFHVVELKEKVGEDVIRKKQVIYKNHPALWRKCYFKRSSVAGSWEPVNDKYICIIHTDSMDSQ